MLLFVSSAPIGTHRERRSPTRRPFNVLSSLNTRPTSMATSARAQKEAYLRRKGVKGPRPPTLEPTFSLGHDENATRTDLSPRKRERGYSSSFAEKRKAALLSRARGGRPRDGDVAVTAVLFAARLKISAAQTKLEEEQETGSGDTAQRAPGERTWKQKRKDAYLRTHHTPAPPPPAAAEVTVSTVSFAAKLKTRSLAAAASGDGEEPEHREKSFAQKRKVGLDSR